jgi:uncharacterized membrane protein YdcZ (DUF606 family)
VSEQLTATPRQFYPLGFAIALPVAWLLGVLSIGIVQLFVDPDVERSSGELLDQLSWYLWLGGSVTVPLLSGVLARRLEAGWATTLGVSVLGAVVYVAGTFLVFGIWVGAYQQITGQDWL